MAGFLPWESGEARTLHGGWELQILTNESCKTILCQYRKPAHGPPIVLASRASTIGEWQEGEGCKLLELGWFGSDIGKVSMQDSCSRPYDGGARL